MSGLFRFTGRGSARSSQSSTRNSATRSRSDPDFSAFGLNDGNEDDRDSEDDDDGEHLPLHNSDRDMQHASGGGFISLGNEVNDPLTHVVGRDSTQRNGYNHAVINDTRIPGGYDFEPQPHQGGGGPAQSGANLGNAAHSHQRNDSVDTTPTAAPVTPGRFTAGAIYARFAAAAGASTNANTVGASRRNRQNNLSTDDDDEEDGSRNETSGLLFDAESSAQEDIAHNRPSAGSTEHYPPSHMPLPARPPQFGAGAGANGRVFGGGQGNDGVFANLSAKPDGVRNGADYVGGDEGDNKDEVLPAYEIAALDTTPPYWETTVITPGGVLGPDDICVDGLPVGNLFGFAWNLLVSMSFQFVGFLLTYLLHTTHAAKNGSRAGLGVTMIQLGFYLRERAAHPERYLMPGDMTGLDGSAGPGIEGNGLGSAGDPNDPLEGWSWWGGISPDPSAMSGDGAGGNLATATLSAIGSIPTQLHGALSGAFDASDPDALAALRNGSSNGMPSLTGEVSQEELMRMSAAANEWMAFMMISIGSFLIIGAVLSYWRAVRWAKAVREGNGPQQDSESFVGRLIAATG